MQSIKEPIRRDIHAAVRKVLRYSLGENIDSRGALLGWLKEKQEEAHEYYSSHLHSQSPRSVMHIEPVAVQYADEIKQCDGREILRDNFNKILETYPETLIFGEDSGKIGGVNQGLEGLQSKYGEHRVFDTGIREATIMGQAIGLALRGLRPIAEIQYLDYIFYALHLITHPRATF